MTVVNPMLPTPGDPRGGEELDVRSAIAAHLADYNGQINNDNLAAGANIAWSKLANGALVASQLGLNDGTTVRRGKSIIATEESRTNAAYGTLTTPDQVANVVVPTDGLIAIAFQGLWKSSVASVGRAAVFIGATQQSVHNGAAAPPGVAEATSNNNANKYAPLFSSQVQLLGGQGYSVDASDVATGQAFGGDISSGVTQTFFGGPLLLRAAAGTYTVSIQFKSSSGSVTVKERKLFVWTTGF